jgi:hypothetical protein
MLAGDRARGPDHLYLVCDRCGGRWQPQPDDTAILPSHSKPPA